MAGLLDYLGQAKDNLAMGLLNQYQQGAPIRQGLAKLLSGNTSPLNDIYGQIKQLGNPNYMKQVNDATGSDMQNIALNANPMMGGTFIGKGAKTWDMANHSKALDMAKNGADERTIWDNTGNFKGADGNWRQEISDNNSKLDENYIKKSLDAGRNILDGRNGYNMDSFLNHNELYSSYPHTANSGARFNVNTSNKSYGEYSPRTDKISIEAKNIDDARSIALHENQHSIQEREGWSSGASPNDIALNPLDYMSKDRVDYAKSLPAYQTSLDKSGFINKFAQNELGSPHSAYLNVLGEAEARATQARMNLTPQERLDKFPFDSYDVPRADLLVRGTGGGLLGTNYLEGKK